MRTFIVLTGQRFGNWTVLKKASPKGKTKNTSSQIQLKLQNQFNVLFNYNTIENVMYGRTWV